MVELHPQVEGVVVKTSSPIDHHGSASPVSQSASLVYVTSPGPPTLPLRETLGQNSRRAPLHWVLPLPPLPPLTRRGAPCGGARRRRRMGMRRRQRGRRGNRDCKIKAGLFEEKRFAVSHHRTSICWNSISSYRLLFSSRLWQKSCCFRCSLSTLWF